MKGRQSQCSQVLWALLTKLTPGWAPRGNRGEIKCPPCFVNHQRYSCLLVQAAREGRSRLIPSNLGCNGSPPEGYHSRQAASTCDTVGPLRSALSTATGMNKALIKLTPSPPTGGYGDLRDRIADGTARLSLKSVRHCCRLMKSKCGQPENGRPALKFRVQLRGAKRLSRPDSGQIKAVPVSALNAMGRHMKAVPLRPLLFEQSLVERIFCLRHMLSLYEKPQALGLRLA